MYGVYPVERARAHADGIATGGVLLRPCGRAIACMCVTEPVLEDIRGALGTQHWSLSLMPDRNADDRASIDLVGYGQDGKGMVAWADGMRYATLVVEGFAVQDFFSIVAMQDVADVVLVPLKDVRVLEPAEDREDWVHLLAALVPVWGPYGRRLAATLAYWQPWTDPYVDDETVVTDFSRYVR